MGGIPPLSSTEFEPGRKTKMTIGGSSSGPSASASSSITMDTTGGGGNVDLDTADIPQGETLAVKTLTLTGAGPNGTDLTFKIFANGNITIAPGGASLDKEFQLSGTKVADIAASANINVTQKTIQGASPVVVSESGNVITIALASGSGYSPPSGYTGTRTVLADSDYSFPNLLRRYVTETWTDGVLTNSVLGPWETYHVAVEESL